MFRPAIRRLLYHPNKLGLTRNNVRMATRTAVAARPMVQIGSRMFSSSHLLHKADHTPPSATILSQLTAVEYEAVSEETLYALTEKFEELAESEYASEEFDVNYSSGVLTVNLGDHGTYVINKQTPNKQIWLSSPTSGPKRYDFVDGHWIYKHDQGLLHELLSREISDILKTNVDFTDCVYGGCDSV